MDASDKPILHVAFGMSAAATLRQALDQLGRRERVIGFMDDLSFGPVDPSSMASRSQWIDRHLAFDLDDALAASEAFWAEATSPDILPVAWVCRNHAGEYSAFLEFIRRIADAPFRVIDASDTTMPRGRKPSSTSSLRSLSDIHPGELIEAGLLQTQTTLSATERDRFEAEWLKLRAENAAFRVVVEDALSSAPITYYDEAIASQATKSWLKGARIVLDAMAALAGRSPSHLVVWSRVLALVDAGRLLMQGDRSDMRHSEVRRAPDSR